MHTVKWFYVFLYIRQNLTSVICLHTIYSISPKDWTLSGTTTLCQSGPGRNDNEGVLHILQSSKARASPSDGLMLYPRHLWESGLASLQSYTRSILQPLSTGLMMFEYPISLDVNCFQSGEGLCRTSLHFLDELITEE